MASNSSDKWVFYAYSPSYAAAVAVAVLFAVAAFAHLFLMIRSKSYYMVPFVIGVWTETIGYILRRFSAAHAIGRSNGLSWYITQSLCIILAPALMAATHYMIFGRLIRYVGERFSPIRAKRITFIFVAFDILSFVTQGAGGSLYSSNNVGLYNVAKTILIVGFLIQIISFGIFGISAAIYHRRAMRAGIPKGGWTSVLTTLYIGCVLILIRNIFRTIEFGSGGNNTGYLLTHEAFYYGLEAVPILLCSFLFLVRHPSRHLPELINPSLRLYPESETPRSTDGSASDLEKTGADSPNTLVEPSSQTKRSKWWSRS